MSKTNGYRILDMGLRVALCMTVCTGIASAQRTVASITESKLYCTGVATTEAVQHDAYLISGEDSSFRNTFAQGDMVYINRGAEQGVKPGDEYEVIRAASDPNVDKWFKYQPQLSRAMGTRYVDVGRLRVLVVQAKTSTAQVRMTCDLMQRGDLIRPFQARPVPALHTANFDPFAPPSGKKTAMIVSNNSFGTVSGPGDIVYVNLGSAQGVRVGDYFRVFRYQGTRFDSMYQPKDTAFKVYGFGSTPVAYQWDNLPRQVLGEGIVLRTGPNSATVMLTFGREGMWDGDYVEIE